VLVYIGVSNTYRVSHLTPCTEYSFTLQTCVVENNEKSEMSEAVAAQTDEAVPSEPLNLKAIGATTSIIKLAWEAPLKPNGQLKNYFIYNEGNLVHQSSEPGFVLAGLRPSTTYEISVCASTAAGHGELAIIRTNTCSLGDITPEKPSFPMVNKREIMVRWGPPQVITGKLNRYELIMNGKCVYSGISLEFQVSLLRPDTEYRFEVSSVSLFFGKALTQSFLNCSTCST
jgi:hypothetical protein